VQTAIASARRGEKSTAFLDTSVILSYLSREGAAAHLFDPEVTSRVRYAINPIVAQELFSAKGASDLDKLAELVSANKINLLTFDDIKARAILNRAQRFRHLVSHSNDILILAGASECDYFVTQDEIVSDIVGDDGPVVLTPAKFIEAMSREA
jgi:predicted nucleic acid-binding protein